MRKWKITVVSDWGERYNCVVEAETLTDANRSITLDPGWHIESIMTMTAAEVRAAARQR
ncbi:MAG: hypothetical protein IJ071_10615 [Ruminococcus sp.]|nr:hypothetical protein [Ruminococcus sp.]